MSPLLLLLGVTLALPQPSPSSAEAEMLAQGIDRFVAAGWTRDKVQPAELAGDAEFVRRIYLDLVGRIPSKEEAQRFCANRDPRKRARLIDELLASGEFPKHWRENLNLLLMGGPAFGGDAAWRNWLETALKQGQGWDTMARTILLARPGKPEDEGGAHFLVSRFAQGPSGLDLATRDVSRFFFGVDIQCARCHKHPEVRQWKQESYWGMAAFLNRSYPLPIKGKTGLAERATGEVDYSTKGKPPKTVPPQFLTGETVVEAAMMSKPATVKPGQPPPEDPTAYQVPPETAPQKTRVPVPKFSRRAKLVELAINTRNPYFKAAAVNYIWSQLLGRGLVEPIDQMHDGNPASHPELLQFLADDFAAHHFDIRYLIRGITNSRTYQLSSRYASEATRPSEATFGCGAVRPLSTHQLAMSLLAAAGYCDAVAASADTAARRDPGALRARLETQDAGLLATLVANLGTGTEPFQPGVRESLFQANSSSFGDLLAKGGLVTRLAAITGDDALIEEACWCVLSRPPSRDEAERLRSYLRARTDRRAAACQQIVWALVTSAEFRFNH
jgi:hypothetical protein